jgi:hypothetical protein
VNALRVANDETPSEVVDRIVKQIAEQREPMASKLFALMAIEAVGGGGVSDGAEPETAG